MTKKTKKTDETLVGDAMAANDRVEIANLLYHAETLAERDGFGLTAALASAAAMALSRFGVDGMAIRRSSIMVSPTVPTDFFSTGSEQGE